MDKIGKIDFWNEYYYFLTENYFIIIKNRKVYAIKYENIYSIFVEKKIRLSGGISGSSKYKEYLHILTDTEEFTVLIYTDILVGEKFRDISKYLLDKNPKIKVKVPIIDKKINIFKV